MATPSHRTGITLNSKSRKQLKRLAHHLHPVVTVGDAGVSDGVIAETDRALRDHELIKVKVNIMARDARTACGSELAAATKATVVQRIGRVLVLFRQSEEPRPGLSNLAGKTLG